MLNKSVASQKLKVEIVRIENHTKRYPFNKFNQICIFFRRVGCQYVSLFIAALDSLHGLTSLRHRHYFNELFHKPFQQQHFVASPLCNFARRHLFSPTKWNSINFVSPRIAFYIILNSLHIYFELVCFSFSCKRNFFCVCPLLGVPFIIQKTALPFTSPVSRSIHVVDKLNVINFIVAFVTYSLMCFFFSFCFLCKYKKRFYSIGHKTECNLFMNCFCICVCVMLLLTLSNFVIFTLADSCLYRTLMSYVCVCVCHKLRIQH